MLGQQQRAQDAQRGSLASCGGDCERVDASFWSEPVNALTNAAFILAALFALRAYRAGHLRDAFLLFLIGTVAVIAPARSRSTRWRRAAPCCSTSSRLPSSFIPTCFSRCGDSLECAAAFAVLAFFSLRPTPCPRSLRATG